MFAKTSSGYGHYFSLPRSFGSSTTGSSRTMIANKLYEKSIHTVGPSLDLYNVCRIDTLNDSPESKNEPAIATNMIVIAQEELYTRLPYSKSRFVSTSSLLCTPANLLR